MGDCHRTGPPGVETGQIFSRGILDPQLALLLQHQDRGCDHGLGIGSHAEQRVLFHRQAVPVVLPAHRFEEHDSAVPSHHEDGSADVVAVHRIAVELHRLLDLGGIHARGSRRTGLEQPHLLRNCREYGEQTNDYHDPVLHPFDSHHLVSPWCLVSSICRHYLATI